MDVQCDTPDGRLWFSVDAVPLERLRGAVLTYTDITLRKQTETWSLHQAMHDVLTRLPNRHLIEDRLTQALAACSRGDGGVAVLFLDLDSFKAVNDTHGHAAGDGVLVEVARRLRDCVRPSDTVGRLAGDEFAVVCSGPR